jgi:hypothetical protein
MNWAKLELTHADEYKEIILFMKNTGLIKDESRKLQFYKNIGGLYYE